ncbi:MAG: glycosyltransferase family 4 protein [Cyclobacteriaceae bacterium]
MDSIANDVNHQWVACQIGAREHYAIPNDLNANDQLEMMITDYWVKSKFQITKNAKGRSHAEIPSEKVVSFNNSAIMFALQSKIKRVQGWELVMKRNDWFQKKAVDFLKKHDPQSSHVFSYSYAAKEIFKYAKERGLETVLGQIDPGPLEEDIVKREMHQYPQYKSEWQPAPKAYWENWYEECGLADKIIVNSEWSSQALIARGVNENKIKIVPLSYSNSEAKSFVRNYPLSFDKHRPLRVLFLGQAILRKGIARVIEVARMLVDKPVEFVIAGPIGISPVLEIQNVKWVGRVPRLDANSYFKNADVFLFPTLSDGFGLTQLEAQAWKLPIIASKNCGVVVRNKENGWVLEEVSAAAIENVIDLILKQPEILKEYSSKIDADENKISLTNYLTK